MRFKGCPGVLAKLTDLMEGKYPTLVHSSHHIPTKGKRENWKILVQFTVRDIGSLNRHLITALENIFLASTPHHYIKDYLTAISFTQYIMSSYHEKIPRHTKIKKHSLKRQSKHGRDVKSGQIRNEKL